MHAQTGMQPVSFECDGISADECQLDSVDGPSFGV